jgi:cyanobactin maturation PatA/PatG family protease
VTAVSGTSFAAAVVSGVAGLLLSLAKMRGLRQSGQQARHFLLDCARKCLDDSIPCRQRLAGRLDLTKAALVHPMKVQPMSDHSHGSPADMRLDDAVAAPSSTLAQVPDLAAGVVASAGAGCDCDSCRARTATAPFSPGSLVFALGHLDIDLVSETRQFSLQQHLWEFRHEKHGVPHDPTRLPNQAEANPFDHNQLLEYLEDEENGWDATAVHWVLKHHQTPIYAIAPDGPFAHKIYSRLIETMREQLMHKSYDRVEWVSIPGRLGGVARLYHGQSVPVIVPEPRGMYSWNLVRLVNKIAGGSESQGAQMVSECLDRVYHDMPNLGLTARDRAINYAVTNAAQLGNVFDKVLSAGEAVALDTIDAEPSSHCPPGADCWDVTLYFFYPERPTQSTRRAYRFSVDVGDVVPVMVGPLRAWYAR